MNPDRSEVGFRGPIPLVDNAQADGGIVRRAEGSRRVMFAELGRIPAEKVASRSFPGYVSPPAAPFLPVLLVGI